MSGQTISFQSTTSPAAAVPLFILSNSTATNQFGVNTLEVGPGPITPVDQAADFRVVRSTTAIGSGGTTTVYPTNPNRPVGVIVARYALNSAIGATLPTYTDILYRIGLHMRANFQWYANINREWYSLVGATTNAICLDLTAISATYQFEGSVVWEE